MPKKQLIVKETAVAAPPARAAKPKTPRVRTTKHSKAAVTHMESHTDSREVIAQIAYGYWESRGFQHGGHLEDWVRAEHEFRNRRS
jgi:hypothetical protein